MPNTFTQDSEGSEGVQTRRVTDPHAPLCPKTPNILPSPAQQGRATVSSYGQELVAKRIVRSLPQPPTLTGVTGVSLTRVLILTVPLPVPVTLSKLLILLRLSDPICEMGSAYFKGSWEDYLRPCM